MPIHSRFRKPRINAKCKRAYIHNMDTMGMSCVQRIKPKQNPGYPVYSIPGGGAKWHPLIIRRAPPCSEKQDHPLAARAEAMFAWGSDRKLAAAASKQNDQRKYALISPNQKQILGPRASPQDGFGGSSQICGFVCACVTAESAMHETLGLLSVCVCVCVCVLFTSMYRFA